VKSLYFIAILIPEPIASEIREFQEYIATHMHSVAALRSPPHITLVPPFAVDREAMQSIEEVLENIDRRPMPLSIHLKGFAAFDRRVIYVHVEPESQLSALASEARQVFRDAGFSISGEGRSFHPHVTIGFKDLTRAGFDLAMPYFQDVPFVRHFDAEAVAILRHSEKRWHVVSGMRFTRD
jgi:2'-5' RNA ligase